MAWPGDFRYLRALVATGVLTSPVLEIGSRNHQGHAEGNAQATCAAAGLQWEGADIVAGAGVDRLLDVLDADAVAATTERWPTVLLFNLLEHVYDPIAALRNATALLAPGGVVVICGPAIWELHDYPADYWRPMPGFFFEHAAREGLTIVDGSPTWILEDRLVPYEALRDGPQALIPSSRFPYEVHGRRKGRWVRVVHTAAQALDRDGYRFPFCSFGIALRRG